MIAVAVLTTLLLSWMGFGLFYCLLLDMQTAKLQYHYRKLYNEQMAELQQQYRQERVAMAHRYEDAIADLEVRYQKLLIEEPALRGLK